MRIDRFDGKLGWNSVWYPVRLATDVDLPFDETGQILNRTKLKCFISPRPGFGGVARFPGPNSVSVHGDLSGKALVLLGITSTETETVPVSVRFISQVEAELGFNAIGRKGDLEP